MLLEGVGKWMLQGRAQDSGETRGFRKAFKVKASIRGEREKKHKGRTGKLQLAILNLRMMTYSVIFSVVILTSGLKKKDTQYWRKQ